MKRSCGHRPASPLLKSPRPRSPVHLQRTHEYTFLITGLTPALETQNGRLSGQPAAFLRFSVPFPIHQNQASVLALRPLRGAEQGL
jgi:hypothetical protein